MRSKLQFLPRRLQAFAVICVALATSMGQSCCGGREKAEPSFDTCSKFAVMPPAEGAWSAEAMRSQGFRWFRELGLKRTKLTTEMFLSLVSKGMCVC